MSSDKAKEAVLLVSRQRELCLEGKERLETIRDALIRNRGGAAVTQGVHELEGTLAALSALDEDISTFLAGEKEGTLYDVAMAVLKEDSAMAIFDETATLQDELKAKLSAVKNLLKRNKLFVDFHINVASQAKAETTYGPPGKGENVSSGRKMFDANA